MASQQPKVYKCNLYPKSFTRNFTLRNHLFAHSGDKAFSCTFCGQKFTRGHDHRVHVKEQHTSTERYPYQCQLGREFWGCDCVFSRKTSLQRHLKSDIGRNRRPPSDVEPLLQASEERLTESLIQYPNSTPNPVPAISSADQRESDYTEYLHIRETTQPPNNARSMAIIPRMILNQSPFVRNTEIVSLQTKGYSIDSTVSDMGREDRYVTPSVLIESAPVPRQASFEVDNRNFADALQPPARNCGRSKSDPHFRQTSSRSPAPAARSSAAFDNRSMQSPSANLSVSRESSPSPNNCRSSTSSIPSRNYILDLADPSRPTATTSATSNLVQKHPTTFQCNICPKRFMRAYCGGTTWSWHLPWHVYIGETNCPLFSQQERVP